MKDLGTIAEKTHNVMKTLRIIQYVSCTLVTVNLIIEGDSWVTVQDNKSGNTYVIFCTVTTPFMYLSANCVLNKYSIYNRKQSFETLSKAMHAKLFKFS